MNKSPLILMILSLAFFLGAGCDDPLSSMFGGSKKKKAQAEPAAPVGPAAPLPPVRIAGNWSGSYKVVSGTITTNKIGISASIVQDGSNIIIRTSKTGAGALLTGKIDGTGKIKVTDASDGELWTTFFGPATSKRIQIYDIILPRPSGYTNDVFQAIDLGR